MEVIRIPALFRRAGILFLDKERRRAEIETRIALIGIIVENTGATDKLNLILHDYAPYIIGRMGIPYHDKGVCIISVVVDAPANEISSLSGKLGMLQGITVKTIYSKAGAKHDDAL